MPPRRLYLDNAATSFPKPPGVTAAMVDYATRLGASAGRGAYHEAVETGTLIRGCRELLSQLFNGADPDHFVFTLNCSDALNLAIKGVLAGYIERGTPAHVICTETDHNSILRPLNALVDRGGVTVTRVPVDAAGLIDPEDIRRAVRPDTRLICLTHGSNVTGAVQPLREVGSIARETAVPLAVDAAQTAGHLPIDVEADCIDLLAAPGHKALLGPLGTGFLYLRPGMEKIVRPLREGGTGSVSEHPRQPEFMPDKYEPGSHNAPGILGLAEGVRWVLSKTLGLIRQHDESLVRTFIDGVQGIDGLTYFGPQGVSNRIGVFSVRVDGLTPMDLAKKLEDDFGLLTRPGLHCAPHIHEALGTAAGGGTTRLSFGPFLSRQDVKFACDALAFVASGATVSR